MRGSATATASPQLCTSRSGATLWNSYHYSYLPCSLFKSLLLSHLFLLVSSLQTPFVFYFYIFISSFIFCLTFYKYVMEASSRMPLKENVSFTHLSLFPPLLSSPISSLPLYYFILFYLITVVFYLILSRLGEIC